MYWGTDASVWNTPDIMKWIWVRTQNGLGHQVGINSPCTPWLYQSSDALLHVHPIYTPGQHLANHCCHAEQPCRDYSPIISNHTPATLLLVLTRIKTASCDFQFWHKRYSHSNFATLFWIISVIPLLPTSLYHVYTVWLVYSYAVQCFNGCYIYQLAI